MPCGCGSSAPGDLWEAVNPDGTVVPNLTKPEATAHVNGTGGYIREQAPAAENATSAA